MSTDSPGRITPERLLESLPGVVFVLDAEGRFVYVSRGTRRTIGLRAGRMVGRRFDEIVAPDHHGMAQAAFDGLVSGARESVLLEVVIPRSDTGEQRHIEVHARRLPTADSSAAVVGLARDITERHERVSAFIMRQRLAGIVDLAVAAAHHINNPLSIIRTHLALLARLESPTAEQWAESCAQMEKAAARIGAVTQRLSALADASLYDQITGSAMVDLGGWPAPRDEPREGQA